MNEVVKGKTEELIRAILNSEQYKEYESLKGMLAEMPELRERVQKFRKVRMESQFSGKEGKEIADLLISQYSDILNNTIAANYLNAELEVCKIMQEINQILLGGLDLELDFL